MIGRIVPNVNMKIVDHGLSTCRSALRSRPASATASEGRRTHTTMDVPQCRSAFTLIELLVVITIISLLMATLVVALAGAQEQAREARTKAQIAKLHEMIMERWESYLTRAVPIRLAMSDTMTPAQVLTVRQTRLNALRELMRMEMPDRFTDITDNPLTPAAIGFTRPALSRGYLARLTAVASPDSRYQSAECLYMIVASIQDGDTTGLDFFKPSEIGDVDNDGLPEILDAWGTPIEFLRWAPGFRSPLQPGDPNVALANRTGDMNESADNDAGPSPDPFDPLRSDARWRDGVANNDPFALFPLIYSAGPSRKLDIVSGDRSARNNPYSPTTGNQPVGLKADADGDGVLSYADNIDNHYREVR
jgi:prepilin-type N-terminal cleavage/methylation domain-containing protein